MISASIGGGMAQLYEAQQQAAYNQSLGQLQQAGLNQMYQNNLRGRHKAREEKILDMECDLSNYLSRSKNLQI